MVRFDAKLLARVDAAAERRGISRSAWIQYTLSRALDDEEAGR
jgi:predicted HicB family RNase H-like nuclease